jgi:hypothetical protein
MTRMHTFQSVVLWLGLIVTVLLLLSLARFWWVGKQSDEMDHIALTLPVLAAALMLLPACLYGLFDEAEALAWLRRGGAPIWLAYTGVCMIAFGTALAFLTPHLLRAIHTLERHNRTKAGVDLAPGQLSPRIVRVAGGIAIVLGVYMLLPLFGV